MSKPFDYFVVLAEMRTGSNFLESNLNAFEKLSCFGEAFNPHFIGYPNKSDLLGVTQSERDASPAQLIAAVRNAPDVLGGFRFFHDHDARVCEAFLPDPRCAKIILTRNPIESYVSWKIARETGQWKLTNLKHHKTAMIRFDREEFETHLAGQRDFQLTVLNTLQKTGQTAFYIAYEDLQDVGVINGLARHLGMAQQMDDVVRSIKKQNPAPLRQKVSNYKEMEQALAGIDHFDLGRTPNFEPRRGAMVPGYIAAPQVSLLYLPIRGGMTPRIRKWLASLEKGGNSALIDDFSQKTLRKWKRQHVGHRSFTVLRHPVQRAHSVFCQHILGPGDGVFSEIRATLRREYKLPIPRGAPDDSYGRIEHRAAFLAFLEFLKKNLAALTSIRVDPHWATQTQLMQGLCVFSTPDMVLREDMLADGLAQLAEQMCLVLPPPPGATDDAPFALRDIYDDAIEAAARAAYQKDYMMFGFGAWEP